MSNMNKNLSLMKGYFKEYLSQFKNFSVYHEPGIEIYKSGIDSYTLNFIFIDSNSLNTTSKTLPINGVIISDSNFIEDKIKFIFDNTKFINKLNLMYKNEKSNFYSPKFYDDIVIKYVNDLYKKDFFTIFAEAKNINYEFLNESMFVNGIPSNHHIFIAYFNKKPIGFFYAISYIDSAFTVDVFVKENYRDMGILNILTTKAKEFAIDNQIQNLYSIPTSQFSMKVVNNEQYSVVDTLYAWIVSDERRIM